MTAPAWELLFSGSSKVGAGYKVRVGNGIGDTDVIVCVGGLAGVSVGGGATFCLGVGNGVHVVVAVTLIVGAGVGVHAVVEITITVGVSVWVRVGSGVDVGIKVSAGEAEAPASPIGTGDKG